MDWAAIIQTSGQQGTKWEFSPKACSWRNGAAKRAIRSAHHTLMHVLQEDTMLDFSQLGSLLATVAAIINTRPLAIKSLAGDNYVSISPRDVLLGRAGRSCKAVVEMTNISVTDEDNVDLKLVDINQRKLVTLWWEAWVEQSFPQLVPRAKWHYTTRSCCIGDIGHVRYDAVVGKIGWRLARVSEVFPDHKGVVRTITVVMRPTRMKESSDYVVLPPKTLTIAVQRFAVLLPQEEQTVSNL